MKKKHVFYSELAYLFGILALAFGCSLSEKADFGMSMVVAPAYIIHLKVSQYISWYSFGMSEYVLQFFVLLLLCLILRRFKFSYLFSFITAVFYGFTLDLMLFLVSFIPFSSTAARTVYFISGMLFAAAGVAMLFHTYISPEAYELFVKEISEKKGLNITVVKTVYDISSCVIGVILSFLFFGFMHFEGVKLGTLICALVNGFLIGRFSTFLEKRFEFSDGLPFRKYFEK